MNWFHQLTSLELAAIVVLATLFVAISGLAIASS
jgi:hypothetical protein